MKQSNTSTLLRLCALVATFVLVGADLSGLAQNTNSSTTNDASMQNDNTTMTTKPSRRRGRRGRRASSGAMNANTGDTTGSMGDNANMAGDTSMQNSNANTGDMTMTAPSTGGRRRRGRRRAAAAAPAGTTMETPADTSGAMPMAQGGAMSSLGRVGDPASLDGTYTGTINYPDGSMTGDATLTITGNNFTLESGGNTQTGTLTTQSFPGQTAVSMRFGTELPAKILSLRAKKTGNGLMLMNTSGESHQFSFHSGGGGGAMGGGRRRRGSRRRSAAPPAPPAEQPATPPPSL
ncbi:MAG: hypothetical protein ACJ74W_15945 [Pyrinomonadaceae bacterium]